MDHSLPLAPSENSVHQQYTAKELLVALWQTTLTDFSFERPPLPVCHKIAQHYLLDWDLLERIMEVYTPTHHHTHLYAIATSNLCCGTLSTPKPLTTPESFRSLLHLRFHYHPFLSTLRDHWLRHYAACSNRESVRFPRTVTKKTFRLCNLFSKAS